MSFTTKVAATSKVKGVSSSASIWPSPTSSSKRSDKEVKSAEVKKAELSPAISAPISQVETAPGIISNSMQSTNSNVAIFPTDQLNSNLPKSDDNATGNLNVNNNPMPDILQTVKDDSHPNPTVKNDIDINDNRIEMVVKQNQTIKENIRDLSLEFRESIRELSLEFEKRFDFQYSNSVRYEQHVQRLSMDVDAHRRESLHVKEELGYLHTKIESLTPMKAVDDGNYSRDNGKTNDVRRFTSPRIIQSIQPGIDDRRMLADDLDTPTQESQREPRPLREEPVSAHPNITRRVQGPPATSRVGFISPRLSSDNGGDDSVDGASELRREVYVSVPTVAPYVPPLELAAVHSGTVDQVDVGVVQAAYQEREMAIRSQLHLEQERARRLMEQMESMERKQMADRFSRSGTRGATSGYGGDGGGDDPSDDDDDFRLPSGWHGGDSGRGDSKRDRDRNHNPGGGRRGSRGGGGGGNGPDPPNGPFDDDDDDKSSDSSTPSNSDMFRGISALKKNVRSRHELDSDVISDSMPMQMRNVEALDLRPLPTKRDLTLRDFEIPNLMSFLKKFQSLQQDFERPLKMATFFGDTVLMRVQHEAQRYKKCARLLDGKDILSRGKQLLSNDQLEDLLRSICKPMSAEEMRKILRKSMYDPEMYKFFRSTSVIMKNFPLYRNYATMYHTQYMARLVMIVDDKNAKYLPRLLDGGSGKGDSKEKGQIQFWLQGFPNRKFATRLWKKCVDESKRKRCRTFDEFVDLYFGVIYKLEKTLRKSYASVIFIFDDEPDEGDPEEPHDYRKSKEGYKRSSSSNRFSRSRGRFDGSVNAITSVDTSYDRDRGSDDDESDFEPPDGCEDIDGKDCVDDSDEKLAETKEEDTSDFDENMEMPEELEWLHGIVMDPQGKRAAPCWKFATTGKCPYGDNCKFSHHAEDVKAYLAAKSLGHDTFKKVGTSKGINWFKEGSGHPSGPGVRPRVSTPTSILKPGADGTRRKV